MYTHTDTPAMHLFDLLGVDTHTHPSHALTEYVIITADGTYSGVHMQSPSAVCAMFTYTTTVHGSCVGYSAVSLSDWTVYVVATQDAATRPNFYDWTISRPRGTENWTRDSYMVLA